MNRILLAALLVLAVACVVGGTVAMMDVLAFDWSTVATPAGPPARDVVVALP